MNRSALISSIAACIVIALAVLGVCAGGAAPQAAQQPQAAGKRIIVDAVVTDKKNRMVTGLKGEDFVVYEDGVPQEITGFEANTPGTSSRPLVMMVLLDYSTTEFHNEKLLREGALKYVQERLHPDDRVSVFALGGGLRALTPFTSDKQLLARAFQWREQVDAAKAGTRPETVIDSAVSIAAAPAIANTTLPSTGDLGASERMTDLFSSMRSGVEQRTSRGVLAAIQALSEGVRNVEGRKAIVLFSQGFVVDPIVEEEMRAVTAAAQRANVSVYCMNTAGLQNSGTAANDPERDDLGTAAKVGAEQKSRMLTTAGENVFDRSLVAGKDMEEAALRFLSTETGGTLTRNTNSFAPALARVDDEMRQGYVLTYQPKNVALDGKYHKIRVEVAKQPGLSVRSRNGYYAAPAGLESLPAPELQLLLAARNSGNEAPQLAVKPAAFRQADGKYRVPIIIEAASKNISFAANGANRAGRLQLVGLAVNNAHPEVPPVKFARTVELQFSEAEYKTIERGSVSVVETLRLPPGAYSLEVAAKDLASSRMLHGRNGVVLNEPEAQLALSTVLLANQFAKATAADQTNPNALLTQGVKILPSAACEFQNGDNIAFYFEVYNAQLNAENQKADLFVDVALQSEGKRVPVGVPRYRVNEGAGKEQGIAVARYLELARLEPGNYALVVQVTDTMSKQVKTAHAPFRIVK